MKKEDVKKKDLKGTPKTLMPLTRRQKFDGNENLKSNSKGNQATHLWAKSQGLPNLTKKRNDEKLDIQLN